MLEIKFAFDEIDGQDNGSNRNSTANAEDGFSHRNPEKCDEMYARLVTGILHLHTLPVKHVQMRFRSPSRSFVPLGLLSSMLYAP